MSKKKNVKKILAYKSHIKTTESSQKQLTKQLEFTIVTLHTYYKNTRVKSIQRCLQVTRNHDISAIFQYGYVFDLNLEKQSNNLLDYLNRPLGGC